MTGNEKLGIVIGVHGATEVQRQFGLVRSRLSALKDAVFSLQSAFVGLGAAMLVKHTVDAAREYERLELTITKLVGSAEGGARTFQALGDYAVRSSAEYKDIMAAASSLLGVMAPEEMMRWIPIVDDLRATYNLSFDEATSNIIRMYNAGAASADLFRDKGILAMMGFEAGVSYSADETRRRVIAAYEAMDSKFRGMSASQARTFDGLMSMISDKWFQYRVKFMEAGPLDYMKAAMAVFIDRLDESEAAIDDGLERVGESVYGYVKETALGIARLVDTIGPAVGTLWKVFREVWQAFMNLKSEHPWLAEVGIFGMLFGGKKGVAAISALAVVANNVQGHSEALALVASGEMTWQEYWSASGKELEKRIKAANDRYADIMKRSGLQSGGSGLPEIGYGGGAESALARVFADIEAKRAEMDAASEAASTSAGAPKPPPGMDPAALSKLEGEALDVYRKYAMDKLEVERWEADEWLRTQQAKYGEHSLLSLAHEAWLADIGRRETETKREELEAQADDMARALAEEAETRERSLDDLTRLLGQEAQARQAWNLEFIQLTEDGYAAQRAAARAWFDEQALLYGEQGGLMDLYRAKLGEIERAESEDYDGRIARAGSYAEAVAATFDKITADAPTEFGRLADLIEETFRTLNNTLSDVFFDAFRGELDSLEDYVLAFAESVQRALANALGDQLAQVLLSGVQSLLPVGAGGAPQGTFLNAIQGTLPTFASGGITSGPSLAGEAGPEAVVPLPDGRSIPVRLSGAASGGGGTTIIINAMDAQSMADVFKRNSASIVGAVRDNIREGGSLVSSVRRAGR